MHPSYTADRPGQCPICNMDLVKKENQELEHKHGSAEQDTVGSKAADKENDTSNKDIRISAEKQLSIGLKTDFVARRTIDKEINLYSSVAYDPELYNALIEYKSARKSEEFLSESANHSNVNLDLRLRQLGLSKAQIRLWTSGQRDPIELILGGMNGRGHIYSQIYESDLRYAKVDQPVEFKTEVYPDITFTGRIKSIDTILDKNNRTLRLRSEVSDPKQLLKPQMFGQIVLKIRLNNLLSLPTSSILDTGNHKYAYVKTSAEQFKATMIKSGVVASEWTEVLDGLNEGDEVVSESTFLIDSEAKIRFGNSETHQH